MESPPEPPAQGVEEMTVAMAPFSLATGWHNLVKYPPPATPPGVQPGDANEEEVDAQSVPDDEGYVRAQAMAPFSLANSWHRLVLYPPPATPQPHTPWPPDWNG
jgi:hypothetical protein